MRRLLIVCVAVTTALLAGGALAGNQEVADQIARNLRESGKLSDYRIAVKFQDGTAWVQGRVSEEKQKEAALKTVFQTPGVTRVIDDLTVGSEKSDTAAAARTESGSQGKLSSLNPLRGSAQGGKTAQPLSSSFTTKPAQRAMATETRASAGRGAVPVAMMQAAPALPAPQMVPGIPAAPVPNGSEVEVAPAAPMPMNNGAPLPMHVTGVGGAPAPVRYDQPCLPNYAWPSYAPYPNYAALTYPKQYSPTAWPYIGPFYPYPQVPLGWRKVSLEWKDGWWFLDFKDEPNCCWWR